MANATGQELALDFNGSSTKIDVGQNLVSASGDFTIELWINLDNVSAGTDTILMHQPDTVTAGQGLFFFANTDFGAAANNLRAYFSDGTTTIELIGSDLRGAGWTHVAFVRNGSNFYLYEDATQVDTGSGSPNIGAGTTYIGYRSGGTAYYLSGIMCDVRFWDDARSQTEISNNKDTPLTGSETNLIAYYKLDEGTGTTANDSTSNNYDGTITSGTWEVINIDYTWTKVADTLSSQSLYNITEYNNKIYASTDNGSLFEWNGTNAWVSVAPTLNSEQPIWDIKVFDGALYGCTGISGDTTSGRLYKWNDSNAWVQVAPNINSIDRVFTLREFNSKLYGGTDTPTAPPTTSGRLLEWNGTNAWVQVATSLSKSSHQCFNLDECNGSLYAGMGGATDSGAIYKWNGTDAWVVLKDVTSGEVYLYVIVFNNKMYASTRQGTGKLYEVNTTTGALTEVAPQLYSQTSAIPAQGSSDKIFAGTQSNAYLYEWNGTDAWVIKAGQYESETELRNSLLYSQDNKIYGISNPSGYLLRAGGEALVETNAATNVNGTSATLNGNVLNDGGNTITERGFAYNTTGSPNIIDDTKVTVSGTTGTMDYDLTGLDGEETYYFVAYATNSEGTAYGSVLSFTTGLATTTAIFEVLEFQATDTTEASTTTTTVNATAHGLVAEDMIVNTTRRGLDAERGSRRVLTASTDSFTVDAITGQTSGDSFRKYKYIDRTNLVKVQTLRCTMGNAGARTLSLTLITDSDYIPKPGQYCRFNITQGSSSTRYFLGIIQDTNIRLLSNSYTAEANDTLLVDIQATALNTVPTRRTIQVAYDADTDFGTIVEDMVDTYLIGDGITQGTIDTGLKLDTDWYDDVISIGDVLDRCAKESGYQWFIDENGALQFYAEPASFTNATYNIDSTTSTFTDYADVTVSSNIDQYLNKYFIMGGYDERGNPIIISSEDFDESTAQQEICAGTGVYGEILRDSGITGSDYVTAAAGTTTTNITYVSHGQEVGDMIWNLTRNQYELVTAVVDADNFTVDAITSQTSGDIIVFFNKSNDIIKNAFKTSGRVAKIVTFTTRTLGFNAGEKMTINIPEMGISSETYLIDKVEVFDYVGIQGTTTNGWKLRVTCVLRDSSNFSTQRLRNYTDFWSNF